MLYFLFVVLLFFMYTQKLKGKTAVYMPLTKPFPCNPNAYQTS